MRKQGWRARAASALIRRKFSPVIPGHAHRRVEPGIQSQELGFPVGSGFRARGLKAAPRNDDARAPVTIITDPLFYALAIPAVVALGLSKGGFAGVGQMATPMLALVMPPLEAAAIFLPIMIVQDWSAVWVYRREWDGRVLAIMIPGALIGIAAAGWLAAYISDAAVRVFIGVTTIVFVVYSFTVLMRVPRPASAGSVPAGVFWGALSGFTSTICQAGGPPYQMYVLSQKMPKMLFVGTTAIFFAVHQLRSRWCPMSRSASSRPRASAPRWRCCRWRSPTNQLGFWLVRRTPQELFYKITLDPDAAHLDRADARGRAADLVALADPSS